MRHKGIYRERKAFEIYDNEHALLYLNEQAVDIRDEETGEIAIGFSYTGNMPDGGTLVAASGVTETNRRDKFISGLIGLSYDMDAQIAILANGSDTPEHGAELAAFAGIRAEAKEQIDAMLSRTF